MVRLKEIGILSYGYITAVVVGVVFLLEAVIILPMINKLLSDSTMFGSVFGADGNLPGWATVLIIILLPILGAIYGFIGGCLGAIIYNLAAKVTGGVEMEFVKAPPSRRKAARRRHSNVIIEEEPVAGMDNTNVEDNEYTEDVVEIAEE